MPITIRKATTEDAYTLADITVDAWRHSRKGVWPEDFLTAQTPEKQQLAWETILETALQDEKAGIWIAEDNGESIGLIWIAPANNHTEHAGVVGGIIAGYEGELKALNVRSAYQRQGVGTQLLQHASVDIAAHGIKRVSLWLTPTEQSRSFYEKHGAVYLGIEQDMSLDGQPVR